MLNNYKKNRPPKPVWGTEVTIPSKSEDPNNGDNYMFSIDDSDKPSSSAESHTYLTPTEEYLQMTKRLIQSKSLPSRTTKKLKILYAKYKSMSNYDKVTFDETKARDRQQKNITKNKFKYPYKIKKPGQSKKRPGDATPLPDEAETPSISQDGEQSENLSMQTYRTEQFDEERNRGSIAFMERVAIAWYGLRDFMFGRPCDPDLIKIDNVFSDFTLQDEGFDDYLKREIRKWMESKSLGSFTSSTIRRIAKDTHAQTDEKWSGRGSKFNGSSK